MVEGSRDGYSVPNIHWKILLTGHSPRKRRDRNKHVGGKKERERKGKGKADTQKVKRYGNGERLGNYSQFPELKNRRKKKKGK